MNNTDNSFLSTLASRKIYINTGTIDFRCGIDSLSELSCASNTEDYYNGALFAYCSKSRSQIRIVFWEGCGAWMLNRKISYGLFKWTTKNSNKEQVLTCYKDLITLLSDPIPQSEITKKKIIKKLSKAK